MKPVLLDHPVTPPYVVVTALDSSRYYGVFYSNRSRKGFISREEYKDGPFKVRSCHVLTNGNGIYDTTSDTLRGTIQKCLESGYYVFEFATHQELFAWLAKDEI